MPARTVTVSVTAEDIVAGDKGRCTSCPLSLALARALGEKYTSVSYNAGCAFLYCPSTQFWTMTLPALCLSFVRAFDRGDAVQPFTFDLTLP